MSRSVVFLGTSAFAVPSLKALADDGAFSVTHVISQPDRPVGRKHIITPPPVKVFAEERNIHVIQPESIKKEWGRLSKSMPQPDFLVVVSYGQLLSQEIIAWPKNCAINVHASLLPKLRGASPIQHAILEGHTETGVTLQRMVLELDAGPILAVAKTSIQPRETYATLHEKLSTMGATLLRETLKAALQEIPQNHPEATFCRKLQKSDGDLDPKTADASSIDRAVRALSPWPGVRIGGCTILSTALDASPEALVLPCKGGSTLFILSLKAPSGRVMSGEAFSRGNHLLL